MLILNQMGELRGRKYSTAQLMKTFELGRNTLRLYEEMGLLQGMTRSPSGYREFTSRHFEDLRFILEAKKVGFTLNEIKELLQVVRVQKKMTCGTVATEIFGKVEEIEAQLRALASKKEFLNEFLKTCGAKTETSECDVMGVGFSKSACCD